MCEGATILVGDDLDNDLKIGFVLIGCSILLFPMMMDLMQEHDDVVREHERECDMNYRLLVLDIIESPDWVLCNELEQEKSQRVSYFLGSLALFVLSGLGGLVMVLPYEESDPRQPPLGGQLR
mgnify:FL=1|jgi:hypothetical protein